MFKHFDLNDEKLAYSQLFFRILNFKYGISLNKSCCIICHAISFN